MVGNGGEPSDDEQMPTLPVSGFSEWDEGDKSEAEMMLLPPAQSPTAPVSCSASYLTAARTEDQVALSAPSLPSAAPVVEMDDVLSASSPLDLQSLVEASEQTRATLDLPECSEVAKTYNTAWRQGTEMAKVLVGQQVIDEEDPLLLAYRTLGSGEPAIAASDIRPVSAHQVEATAGESFEL
jgi:hypothetical protein